MSATTLKKATIFVSLATVTTSLLMGSAMGIPKDLDGKVLPIPEQPLPPQPPQAPQREVRISAPLIAALVEATAQGTQMHLNNHGPRRGNSWQVANDSYVRLPSILGGGEYRFNIPEAVKDLDCGWACPDLGDAKFYVNDLNLDRVQVGWQNPTFKLSLFFEGNGREVKGYHTGSLKSLGDNGMPDLQINNARLDVYLRPVARNGRLSYSVVKTDFNADMQATGGCKVLGFDICDFLFDYKDKLAAQVKNQVLTRLNDPALRDRVADAIQPELQRQRIGQVTRVKTSGNDLIIETPTFNVKQILPPLLPVQGR